MKTANPLGRAQVRVEEHAVDDEPHEQRLDHLQAGADERETEDDADAVSMRPQPAQVFSKVLASLAAEPRRGLRRRLVRDVRWRLSRLQSFRGIDLIVEHAPVCSPERSAGSADETYGLVHPWNSWRDPTFQHTKTKCQNGWNDALASSRACDCGASWPEWWDGRRTRPAHKRRSTSTTLPTIASHAEIFEQFVQASRLIAEITRHDTAFTYAPLFTKEVALSGDAPAMAAGLVARLENHTGLTTALQTAKLTSREYTKFAIALLAAHMAHGFVKAGVLQRVPAGAPTHNVDFVNAHEPEVTAVLAELGVRD